MTLRSRKSHRNAVYRSAISLAASVKQWALRRISGCSRSEFDLAKNLLRKQEKTLSDVALACGFADQSHFTRVFTRMTGISPGAWRRGLEQGEVSRTAA